MNIAPLLARRTRGLKPSPIRKLNPLMRLPGMISLGGGYPNAQTFALTSVEVVFKSGRRFQIRDESMDLACQYGPTDANADLKPHLLKWHAAKDGVDLKGEQIQVLNGAQEGLHTMAYLFLDEEDSVALSEPAYPGAIAAFRAFTQHLIPIPVDAQGMVTGELERILARKKAEGESLPKFIYDVPNGNNPAGVILSLERRRHLLQLASKYDLLILEDDPYQLIQLEDRDPCRPSSPWTVRTGLSAWTVSPRSSRRDCGSDMPRVRPKSSAISSSTSRDEPPYQRDGSDAPGRLFGNHSYEEFRALIRENCKLYRRNRDAILSRSPQAPAGRYSIQCPRRGMFLWFEMPEGFDAERMMEKDGMDAGHYPASRQRFFDDRRFEKLHAGQFQHDLPGAGR